MVPTPHTIAVPTPHPIVVPTPQPSHTASSPIMVHIASRPSSSSNPTSDLANTSYSSDSTIDDVDPTLHE